VREQDLRDYLGGFDFRGDMVRRRSSGSPAAKSRAWCSRCWSRAPPNLLLLDEPTNHLDLEMRHALTRALAGFTGSLVLVSHDRALLKTVCDRFLLVADGRAAPFEGDVDDYLAWLNARRAAAAGRRGSARARSAKAERIQARQRRRGAARGAPRAAPAARQGVRPAREAARALQKEQGEVESALADPALYGRATPTDPRR
jgi:ATP-binding cassette, subfamily F, member 3